MILLWVWIPKLAVQLPNIYLQLSPYRPSSFSKTCTPVILMSSLVSSFPVTNYNNVVEAGSDSDDEDKLHIVEEEGSLADGADCESTLPEDEHPREHCWDRGEDAQCCEASLPAILASF